MENLLPTNALAGVSLSISVSNSPQLNRLGLEEEHLKLAVGEIARAVVTAGGKLVYGGDLRANGFTTYLRSEVERYNRRDQPLIVVLDWFEYCSLPLSEIEEFDRDLGLLGKLVCLDERGIPLDPLKRRDKQYNGQPNPEYRAQGLTAQREFITKNTGGRLIIGGKTTDFEGRLPGVLEEALLAAKAKQPIYLAGGFGGMASLIAKSTLLVNEKSKGAFFDECGEEVSNELKKFGEYFKKHRAQIDLENGLTFEENSRLAQTYRPSEVATLVSLGLGRKYSTIEQ